MDSQQAQYNGSANLEAMEHAVRYNEFLYGLLRASIRPGSRVLDFGAGLGMLACRIAADPVLAVSDLVCVEPDDTLRARLVRSGLAARRSLEDVKGEFDFAYTFNVLEHIEDDRAALAALFRALKPGGRLLVYVPAFAVLFSAMDRKVGHVRRYIRRELVERCQSVGFEVESASYADSLGFLASLWLRAFGNTSGELNPRLVSLYDRFIFPISRMLDRLTGWLFGKNVTLRARRPLVQR